MASRHFTWGYVQDYFLAESSNFLEFPQDAQSQEIVWDKNPYKTKSGHFYTSVFVQLKQIGVLIGKLL